VLEEVENAVEDPQGEVERMQELERVKLATDCPGAGCAQCQEEGDLRKPFKALNRRDRSVEGWEGDGGGDPISWVARGAYVVPPFLNEAAM